MNTTSIKKYLPKQKWIVILLIVTFVLMVISYIFKAITPIQEKKSASWNGVTPGKTKLDQLQKQLGESIGVEESENSKKLLYESSYPTLPNEVIIDNKNTVQFIKENVDYQIKDNVSNYINELGEPNLILLPNNQNLPDKAYIFLDRGLVVLAHIADGSVEQKWYFTPTSEEVFLSSWGENLSASGSGPEKLQ